ncbi:MAG: cell division protein FtsQ/DivIB [Bryobacteraceae bacterium]
MAREQPKRRFRWRLYLGVAAAMLACASAAAAGMKVRAFALTGPQFALSPEDRQAITISGLRYASRTRVLHAFSGDWEKSVFAIPLDERRRRLLAVDWVQDASVSRVWPNRIAVRIAERLPVAFVNLSRPLLVDAEGVLLEPPAQARFSFPVLSGITEAQGEPERRARVRAMLRLLEDLGNASKDISEVNAAELDNLKVVAQFENIAIELVLGDRNFARRYETFVAHYPEIRKRTPEARRFDLRLDDRIVGAGG